MTLQDHGELPGAGEEQTGSGAGEEQKGSQLGLGTPVEPPAAAGHRHGGGQSPCQHPNSALGHPDPL